MDIIVRFITSFASYFIISYFIYSILGRKRTASVIVLAVIFVVQFFGWLPVFRQNVETPIIVLSFLLRVAPVILATFFFMIVSGGLPSFGLQFKKKRKVISNEVQTKKLLNNISYLMIIGSLIFIPLTFFSIEPYLKYVIIFVLLCSLIFGIYVLSSNLKITSESVILIIGKNRQKIFKYPIDKKMLKVAVSDFFTNKDYIVDPIGVAILVDKDKKREINHLFWVATNDKIDMTGEPIEQIENLSYYNQLKLYEKYNYRIITFQVSKQEVTVIKNRKV